MGLYDDGGVKYAEGVFQASRERIDKKIKEKEEKERNFMIFDGVVRGANLLINNAAEDLHQNQMPQKTSYEIFVNRAAEQNRIAEENKKNGVSTTQYLQGQAYERLLKEAQKTYSGYELTSIQPWLRDEAKKMTTKAKIDAFDNFSRESLDIPDYETFQEKWSHYQDKQAPRNIFEWATKGTKNFFKKETPETIAYKKGVAKDALYGNPIIQEFKEVKATIDAYDGLGFDSTSIMEQIDDFVKDGKLKKKIKSVSTAVVNGPTKNGMKTSSLYAVITNADNTVTSKKLDGTESTQRDDSAYISVDNSMKLYATVKDEHVEEVKRILDGGLKENLDAAFLYLSQNDGYKANLSDIKTATETAMLQWQMVIQTKFDENGMAMFEEDSIEREYQIRPQYLARAKEEGWDSETYLNDFLMEHDVKKELEGKVDKVELETRNFKPIEEVITDEKQFASFMERKQDPNSLFSQMLLRQSKKQPNQTVITLPGDDLAIIPGMTGKGKVKYNVETGEVLIQPEEGSTPSYKISKPNTTNTSKSTEEVEIEEEDLAEVMQSSMEEYEKEEEAPAEEAAPAEEEEEETKENPPTKQIQDMSETELESYVDEKRGEIIKEGVSNLIEGLSAYSKKNEIKILSKAISDFEKRGRFSYSSPKYRAWVEERTGERFNYRTKGQEKIDLMTQYLEELQGA